MGPVTWAEGLASVPLRTRETMALCRDAETEAREGAGLSRVTAKDWAVLSQWKTDVSHITGPPTSGPHPIPNLL